MASIPKPGRAPLPRDFAGTATAGPGDMAPSDKARNSAISTVTRMVQGDMGARIRVQQVPWHPAQPSDNAPVSGAEPVRTVHYILNAKGVRQDHRMASRHAPHFPAQGRPLGGPPPPL